jgi:hypothetical protein
MGDTRFLLAIGMLASCASASDEPASGAPDAAVDARGALPPDACGDSDGDNVCNAVDKCPGYNDAMDADTDTIADGCDKCPGADDKIDVNTNTVADCLETQTRMINLKAVGTNLWRGWHATGSSHSTDNDNTLTGEFTGQIYNSYFVFPLTGFTTTKVTSVTLEIQLEAYTSTDATETFSVWDVTATSSAVETTASSGTILNDLQTGTQYATAMTTAGQVSSILSIPLDAQAATHATAKLGGEFVIGAHLDTNPGYIRFGHTGATATPTVIRLVVKSIP